MESTPRQLNDPTAMRALAHPVRLALLEALRAEGELTASRAGAMLGESAGNMSWHLQTLAKYGFVEETGTGKGRSRPWRVADRSVRFSTADAEDTETEAAADALESAIIARSFEQLETWRRQRDDYEPEWAAEAFILRQVGYLTPEDLHELSVELMEILDRYTKRHSADQRPDGARPVRLYAMGHPFTHAD